MPIQIKGDIKIDPNGLLQKPELAAHIALISSLWAEIEDGLAFLYAAAMRMQPVLAAAAFGRVNSLAAKLDMLETALGFTYSAQAKTHFRKHLRDTIRDRAKDRSKIVHSIWTVRDDLPDHLIRTKGLTDPQVEMWAYRLQDFLEIEIRLVESHLSLKEFGRSLAGGRDFAGPPETGWRVPSPIEDQSD